MSEWQPIDTAPKDGSNVLVCIAGLTGSQGEAFWYQGDEYASGWITWDGANHTRTFYTTPPTHWMPLPEPPEAA
jgi:hypothetical protein